MNKLELITKNKTAVFALDLSWHLYRNYYTFKHFGVTVGGYTRPTGHIYGILATIKLIKETHPGAVIIITQDGVPKERIELMNSTGEVSYKEGRAELEFDFYKDIPLIKALACKIEGVYWAYNEDKECDDLMYAISKQVQEFEDFKGITWIYSGDNDLLQSIDDRTVVTRKKDKYDFEVIDNTTVMTDERFTKKFRGCDCKHLPNYRAIVGDSSDKIYGIKRFPREFAVKIAMSADNITEGCNVVIETEKEKKWYDILLQNRDLVERNYKLMKLYSDFEIKISKPLVPMKVLYEQAETLQLKSVQNILQKYGLPD